MSISYEIKNILRKVPIKGLKKSILLEVSEFANKDGGSIFPSFETLAIHVGATREWVTKSVKSLCDDGWLRKLTSYKNRPNLYCLDVQYIKEFHKQQQDEVLTEFTPECTEFTVNNENHCELNSQHCELNSHKLTYNYQLTNYNIVQKINFSQKTEPIQNSKPLGMEEQIILKTEKPVEVKKTYQQALPFSEKEAEKKPPKVKSENKETKIDPNMELTPERLQIALDQGFHSSWVKDEFNDEFKVYYLKPSLPKSKAYHVDWNLTWKNWCKKAIEFNTSGTKTRPHPVKSAVSFESPINLDSPPAKLAVVDKNLGSFVKTFPHIDSASIFAEAQMLRFGDKITIYHKYDFCLKQMKIEEDRLLKFFNVSTVEFTTEPLEKPSIKLVWPPKPETEKPSIPENKPEPYTPPTTGKPPRYRTLNESYQGSTAKSLGANLNALQRSYQQKLQTTG